MRTQDDRETLSRGLTVPEALRGITDSFAFIPFGGGSCEIDCLHFGVFTIRPADAPGRRGGAAQT